MELYAFSARLSEDFDASKLREAFATPAYVRKEEKRLQELQLLDDAHDNSGSNNVIQSNERLAGIGAKFLEASLLKYTRSAFPYLPEDGVEALVKHLMTERVLSDISFHIGTKDLIMSEVFTIQFNSTHLSDYHLC